MYTTWLNNQKVALNSPTLHINANLLLRLLVSLLLIRAEKNSPGFKYTLTNPGHHGLGSENGDFQTCFCFQFARFTVSKHTESRIEISILTYSFRMRNKIAR